MDRGQMDVGLVVQLYPSQPEGESCSVDTRNNLHGGEAAASVGLHRRFHERRRSTARTREVVIFEAPFQVVLPHRNKQDKEDNDEEKANDICVLQNNWEPCQYREMGERTSIFPAVPNCGRVAQNKYDGNETIRWP